jgi:hypothetical protein
MQSETTKRKMKYVRKQRLFSADGKSLYEETGAAFAYPLPQTGKSPAGKGAVL